MKINHQMLYNFMLINCNDVVEKSIKSFMNGMDEETWKNMSNRINDNVKILK